MELKPITRKEIFLQKIIDNIAMGGSSGGVTINNQDKTITENGTYTADEGFTGLGTVTVDIQSGGGDEASSLDSLIDRSITEVSSNAESVGDYAFQWCKELTTVSLPLAKNIGSSSFGYCEKLTTIDFPEITYIGERGFTYCTTLTTANFPNLIDVDLYAFSFCTILKNINMPNLTKIGSYMFQACSELTTADFPKATTIGDKAFTNCKKLTTVIFPIVTSVGNNAFEKCDLLETINLPLTTTIGSTAFSGCSQLTNLILRSTTMATLSNANSLLRTKIASGNGYIYVPRALVDSYKSATNWSTYATQFRALEDYTVDGTITGELDPTKI